MRIKEYIKMQAILHGYALLIVILLLTILAALTGCGQDRENLDKAIKTSQEKGLSAIAQANANNQAIASTLRSDVKTATMGEALTQQGINIKAAWQFLAHILSATVAEPVPSVSALEWKAAKDDALAQRQLASRLEAESVSLQADLREKQNEVDTLRKKVSESGFWDWLSTGAFLTTVGGAGLWIARLLNVPGMQFIYDPLVRMIGGPFVVKLQNRAQELGSKIQVATTAVMASDVARAGLRLLDYQISKDPDTAQRIKIIIDKSTGGRASSIEEAFKVIAKGVATDEGKPKEIDDLLTAIRSEMPTTMGEPVALAAMKVS